jgi:hypothetical protein
MSGWARSYLMKRFIHMEMGCYLVQLAPNDAILKRGYGAKKRKINRH